MIKKGIAILLLAAICVSLCACRSAASMSSTMGIASGSNSKKVEKLINKIGTVTADSREAVETAEDAYNSLSEDEKAEVSNVQVLLDARTALDSALRIYKVERLIDAIGEVTDDTFSRVDDVKALFDELSAEEQAQVANSDTLTAALEKMRSIESAELQKTIVGEWNCTFSDPDAIRLDDIVNGYVGESTLSLADYLTSGDMTVYAIMQFREDGTFTLRPDEEKMAAEEERILSCVSDYYSDTLRVSVAGNLQGSYGIAFDPFYDFAWQWGFGMSFEAMAEQMLGKPVEEILAGLTEKVQPVIEEAINEAAFSSGVYRLGDGKLYLGADSISDNSYVVYEKTEDTIVFTESVQETFFGTGRMPVTLTK